MSGHRRLVVNLLAAGKLAASQKAPDEATRKRLALCAVAVAHAGAWEILDGALGTVSEDAQDYVIDALEYVVEHPVFVDPAGKSLNARLFVVPISQILNDNVALQYLPHGEVIQELLTQALCPAGTGILVNRLFDEDFLSNLSFQQVWTIARSALAALTPGSAEALEDLFVRPEGEVVTGLHFAIFIALAPSENCDALLDLDGDELAIQATTVMDVINPMVLDGVREAGQTGLSVCLHLPQPFFYNVTWVELMHDSYLFAMALRAWHSESHEEGSSLSLRVLDGAASGEFGVVVEASLDGVAVGAYRFSVESDDREMKSEVCASVVELSLPYGCPVLLDSEMSMPDDEPLSLRILALMPGTTTLQ